ncbi:MAG: hypothetical protein ACXVGB_00250 [Mycobacteriaceae bacterium]
MQVAPQPFDTMTTDAPAARERRKQAVKPARPPRDCTPAEFRAFRLADHAYRKAMA